MQKRATAMLASQSNLHNNTDNEADVHDDGVNILATPPGGKKSYRSQVSGMPVLEKTVKVGNRTFIDLLRGSASRVASLALLRASAGLLDLFLAGALYLLILLLQGQAPVSSHIWMPLSILGAATLVALILPLRGGLEIVSLQAVLAYLGHLQTRYSLELAKGYSEMSWRHFTQKSRSDFTNLATNTVREAVFFQNLIIELIGSGIVIIAMVVAMIYRSPQTAGLISLIVLFGYGVNRYFIRARLRIASREKEIAERGLQHAFSNIFLFGKEMRTYSAQTFLQDRVHRHLRMLTEKSKELMLLPQVTKSLTDQGILMAFVVTVISVQLRGGNIHRLLSLLVYYLVLSRRLLPLIGQVSFIFSQMEGSYTCACIVAEELEDCHRYVAASPIAEPPAKGLVLELDGVYFQHEERKVLQKLSLTIQTGETLLLRGMSGSGKTSLLNLIAGVIVPDAGMIRVDRRRIAYIPQETALVGGSIRDNLLLGGDTQNDEALYEALRVALLDEVVCQLPEGLDTSVGDGGIRFSGGERQRLGIARAIARRPNFLLMDEATSALDKTTERRIFEGLRLSGMSLLVVTHHLYDNLVRADRELTLAEGHLIENRSQE
jgi:ABC-type multidrug transport system fused ATPase/permease subunit